MRVAIVHDWLYVVGGAERVLGELLTLYPQADVFTLFDFLTAEDRARIGLGETRTSFLQNVPLVRKHHRMFLPIMPITVEQFDLTGYDLVISSSSAVAKGVLTGPDQLHVSYVLSPMRYAWDMQHAYLRDGGYDEGVKGLLARLMLHRMRMWDIRTANGPDAIVAVSDFIARRVRKAYGRSAQVIYPPVTLADRGAERGADRVLERARGDHFLVASRLVPYKNVMAVVEAFGLLPDLKLVVAGSGPEAERLKAAAGPNVSFAGFVSDAALRDLMGSARAFIFAAEEDFGIVPVEAQAEGTPVLALGRGGACETVVPLGINKTGMFFDEPAAEAIAACVRAFTALEPTFSRSACRAQAERFSPEIFRSEFAAFVEGQMARLRPTGNARFQAEPRLRSLA